MTTARRIRLLSLILVAELALALVYWSYRLREQSERALERRPSVRARFQVLESFVFNSKDALKDWDEKVFKGKTEFKVITDDAAPYLKSVSKGASTGLYRKLDQKVLPNLHLAWRWRALKFPQKEKPEKLANRSEDDFAARVYAIFPGSTFFNTNVIEYIWDEHLPVGTVASSPFSDRVKLIVIRSGRPAEGEDAWVQEERNIYEDYYELFGKKPDRNLGALAIMSDSDNTKTESESDFGTLVLKTQ